MVCLLVALIKFTQKVKNIAHAKPEIAKFSTHNMTCVICVVQTTYYTQYGVDAEVMCRHHSHCHDTVTITYMYVSYNVVIDMTA